MRRACEGYHYRMRANVCFVRVGRIKHCVRVCQEVTFCANTDNKVAGYVDYSGHLVTRSQKWCVILRALLPDVRIAADILRTSIARAIIMHAVKSGYCLRTLSRRAVGGGGVMRFWKFEVSANVNCE